MKELCIGGPLNGEWVEIEDGRQEFSAPMPVEKMPGPAPWGTFKVSQAFEICRYEHIKICGNNMEEQASFWIDSSLSFTEVLRMLIQGYAELHDIRKSHGKSF